MLWNLAEFLLNNSLQDVIEFGLHFFDCRWDQMPKLVVKFRSSVNFFSYTGKIDEVLWIWLWTVRCWNGTFVVDFLVVICSFVGKFCCFGKLFVEVGLISTAKNVDEWAGFFELLQRDLAVSFSQIHSFASIWRSLVLICKQVEVSLRIEVLGVVSENISKLSRLVGSKLLIHLIAFEGLLEINWYLSSDLCKDLWSHACIACFLEEEILSLSEA